MEPEPPPSNSTKGKTKESKKDALDWLKLIMEFVALAALIYYTCETRRTNNLTQNSLDVSKEQMRINARPWVGLTDEGITPVGVDTLQINDSGDAQTNVFVCPKNYSGGGAQNVQVASRLLLTSQLSELDAYQERICRDELVGNPKQGFVLFPGKYKVAEVTLAVYTKDQWLKRGETGLLRAYIVGCIGYRDQFMYLYHAKFVYQLTHEGVGDPAAGRPVEFMPIINTTIPGKFVWMHSSFE